MEPSLELGRIGTVSDIPIDHRLCQVLKYSVCPALEEWALLRGKMNTLKSRHSEILKKCISFLLWTIHLHTIYSLTYALVLILNPSESAGSVRSEASAPLLSRKAGLGSYDVTGMILKLEISS